MKGKSLKKAGRLFRARKFPEVIRLLEPQVFRFRENFSFFYFLGISCLYTGDFGGAYSYLKRGNQLNPENIRTMEGLAAVYLKRRETQEALQLWLRIVDLEPSNRTSKRGLAFLRRYQGSAEFAEFIESGKVKRFFPSPGRYVPTWVFAAVLVAAITAGGYFAVPALIELSESSSAKTRSGLNAAEITLPLDAPLYELSGQYTLILTESEIRQAFEDAIEYFHAYRDNLAQRELNRIFLSNASTAVKDKARLIQSYLKEPSFTTLDDNFTYSEIREQPFLYENCYVKWKGRITNLKALPDAITFDLLVGYEDGKILEGTVPAFLSFSANLQTEFPLEVLGCIQVKDNIVSLRVTSLHQLAP